MASPIEETLKGFLKQQTSGQGILGGAAADVETRRKNKLELALLSKRLELEVGAKDELAQLNFDRNLLTPETSGLLGQIGAQAAGEPQGSSLFPQGQQLAPAEGTLLERLQQNTLSGLDSLITDPQNPAVTQAAALMGISPEAVVGLNGISRRELNTAVSARKGIDVNVRQGNTIEQQQRRGIKQIETRFASTQDILGQLDNAVSTLTASSRLGAIPQAAGLTLERVGQLHTGNSPEDQAIRNAVAIFGRQREAFALKITQGISGVQMRKDERISIERGLPQSTDTLAYAQTYLSNFTRMIEAGKDAEVLALTLPVEENVSFLKARTRQNLEEIETLKAELIQQAKEARKTPQERAKEAQAAQAKSAAEQKAAEDRLRELIRGVKPQ